MSTKVSKKVSRKQQKVVDTSDESDKEIEKELEDKLKVETPKVISPKKSDDKFETTADSDEEKQDIVEKDDIQQEKCVAQPTQTIQPTVTKSIVDFDQDEIKKYDDEHTKTVDDMTLLKILVVRGKDNHNPALWSGAQRLLKQLNFEIDGSNNGRYRGSQQHYAQQQNQFVPNGRGMMRDDAPRNFRQRNGFSQQNNQQRNMPRQPFQRPMNGDSQEEFGCSPRMMSQQRNGTFGNNTR